MREEKSTHRLCVLYFWKSVEFTKVKVFTNKRRLLSGHFSIKTVYHLVSESTVVMLSPWIFKAFLDFKYLAAESILETYFFNVLCLKKLFSSLSKYVGKLRYVMHA